MKRLTVCGLVVYLLILSEAGTLAETITIPLPGLIGSLGRYPNSTTEIFDFGVSFVSIDDVRFQCSGTINRGLGSGDGVERPVLPSFQWPGEAEVFMNPGDLWYLHVGPYDGPFSDEQSFRQLRSGSGSWDFLLDGQAEITAHITSGLIVIGGVMVSPPTATITDAHLIIEGTVVPEPATLLLFGLGAVFLKRRR